MEVLVVDDDRHILRMLQLMLDMEGYQVLTAVDGKAALEMFDAQRPELVLLDIKMPGIEGYTVCRRIRAFSQVPIIMIIPKGEMEEKAHGLDVSASATNTRGILWLWKQFAEDFAREGQGFTQQLREMVGAVSG